MTQRLASEKQHADIISCGLFVLDLQVDAQWKS